MGNINNARVLDEMFINHNATEHSIPTIADDGTQFTPLAMVDVSLYPSSGWVIKRYPGNCLIESRDGGILLGIFPGPTAAWNFLGTYKFLLTGSYNGKADWGLYRDGREITDPDDFLQN